ncbi:tRNA uridine-5-carboxymethylaminomethyl(34) synthesis GTPase MnmE [Deminuibacter soli]|uniref:tRNA modification GTPase MnmE n=1 Tax=Deminuibacter soli TaxID=2291815 RepID=A0A3E1NS50_9BACT|nr:tRNA uridine-5-carboxymethylaminomethyl(34) synthesis GTPase MnmE [Deminuibacter soli]RFM30588.1 tRNA uridine-5-carboxymethylaminomethyl(34) synthesis GTPase MnmE [Deminuibacter soli]
MHGKLAGWNDTITALATPQGIGAIGVIRVSGTAAIDIVNELFPSKDLTAQPSHTLHVGFLKSGEVLLDEVVVALFKAPKSFTGENVVEISCHGSHYIQEQVLAQLVKQGARIAKPGEFTQRAFINGKMDLTQAEAVADIIASNTEASKRNALQNIRGGFSHTLKQLRDQLISFSALIELELDFSQEDVTFADRPQLFRLLDEALVQVNKLLQSFKLGNVIKNGVQVAIIGKPNAGKSTLLNTLLNEERAIVSDIAGTTRDTIEEVLNINGVLFRLIDTAGIREHTSDVIETIGVEKSMAKMREADIVLYLYDITQTTAAELQAMEAQFAAEHLQYLLVANKADQLPNTYSPAGNGKLVTISAKNEQGIEDLKQQLFKLAVSENLQTDQTLVTNARHVAALQEVYTALQDIRDALDNNIPGDLLAIDIRRCLHFLGEITGEVTNEDQLDYIFSKFCIGK